MTVTKDLSLLCSFKIKINEAASYVPRMHVADKVKAIHFWNSISEKLQEIVNNCSTDISAVTIKTTENEFDKMHLEINCSRHVNTESNCSIAPDLTNLPSNFGINNELIEQYSVDISNAQLLTSETFPIVTDISLSNIHNISQFNSLNSSMSSCEKNVTDNYFIVDNLPDNCDTFVLNPHLSVASRTAESVLGESVKDYDYIPKESDQVYESETAEEISEHSIDFKNAPMTSSNTVLTKGNKASSKKDDKKFSVLRLSLLKNKSSNKCKKQTKYDNEKCNVSDTSEVSKDSIKSEFDSPISTTESDSSQIEQTDPIVSFVVSCSEEILTKNELSPELNKKCSESCIGSKCLHLKPYKCSDCSGKFSSKGNLNVHMRKHTGEKPYSCLKCSSSFTTKGNLKRHSKVHTGEKPFECIHCGGKFTEKKSLDVHMRRHTGEKPYECKECGKKFAQSGILRTHMDMHWNQKIHLCEHCGKSFRQKSQLHVHKLRHENIRKYSCTMCTSRFLTKGDLERHIRIHTGEKPFLCEVCSKTFTRKQSLDEHMNRHYGLRPYVCKYCSRTFTEMSACYKHVKHHEKVAAGDSENLQTEFTECSSENYISHDNSLEILKPSKDDVSKSEGSGLSSKDETVESNQTTIPSCIDNFIV